MKIALTISRIIVGLLFIFSGLVKANDPLSLSYKMQEFFEVWGWKGLDNYTLGFSILMIAFEIIAGVAVLIGWRMKLFSWLLLAMILFFTFLTGYAYYSSKFKNCGCFGDCLPITPRVSFIKDIILTLLIGFIFLNRKKMQSVFSNGISAGIVIISALFSFGIQWYILKHLPFADCLPYKAGNNIQEKMKSPPNAIQDSSVITFVYTKEGKNYEFPATKFPTDLNTYTYKSRYDKLIRKGNATPPIQSFSLTNIAGIDTTNAVLERPGYTLLLFAQSIDALPVNWKWNTKNFAGIKALSGQKNYPLFLITSNPKSAIEGFTNSKWDTNYILACDNVPIKTAARVNPTLYILKKGTIVGKWSYNDFDKALKFIKEVK
jgi:uncharacterized membrane protein YphA (DoxX/SURF4 family)